MVPTTAGTASSGSYSADGAMTLVNSLLGNMDETVRYAERAITQRDPQVLGIKTTPAYANLRSDPRYPAPLGKMNLLAKDEGLARRGKAKFWPSRRSEAT